MSVSRKLRRLAAVVDRLEADSVTVVDASIAEPDADGQFRATVELQLDADAPGTVAAEEPAPSVPAGSESAAVTASDVEDEPPDSIEEESVTGRDGPTKEESFECPVAECDATFESEPGMKIHRTKVHRSNGDAGAEDDAEPAYRDPERLRKVYAEHETFPAMRDALDADVSTQTVRRHMIKHGIHDPDASGDGSADEHGASNRGEADGGEAMTTEGEERDERLLTDGASLADALPESVSAGRDLTVAQLRDGIEAADTLYDVQQQFDLEREQAQDLLEALDLLELVHGRVATRPEREELKAEIDRRIRDNLGGASA